MMKLRLLNASHCAMAVIGDLIGFKFIDEVMMDSTVSRYIRALMDREFQPTLLPGILLSFFSFSFPLLILIFVSAS